MIDAARALRDETVAEIDTHEAEIARLRLLADALEAFIDQPERTLEDGHAVGTDTPAPATEPPAPSRVVESRRRPRGTGAASRGPSAPASQPPPSGSQARPADALRCLVPGCDPTPFVTPQALGAHRRYKHPRGAAQSTPAEPMPAPAVANAKADHPSRASWLCGRCPGRFSTEEKRQEHYDATGHGSTEPLPGTPVGGTPGRRPPATSGVLHPGAGGGRIGDQRHGAVGGMGE